MIDTNFGASNDQYDRTLNLSMTEIIIVLLIIIILYYN